LKYQSKHPILASGIIQKIAFVFFSLESVCDSAKAESNYGFLSPPKIAPCGLVRIVPKRCKLRLGGQPISPLDETAAIPVKILIKTRENKSYPQS